MQTNDSDAIGAVLHGDKDKYGVLVDKYKKMVYAIAWSHLGDSDLSEDVSQETFIKAYSYLGTLRNPEAFSAWLARIARNVCGTFHRRTQRERAFTQRLGVLESAETPSVDDDRESLDEQLWQSFADLPAIHREALTLFHVEGKSAREAAVALGISEPALRARLHRARIALRKQLELRLEDTLDNLQPSKDFTRSVCALLPLTPKGALGAGGGLALAGKALATLSFTFWLLAVQIAGTAGLTVGLAKLAADDIKDTPANQFRKVMIRRSAIIGGAIMVAVMALSAYIVMMLLAHGLGLRIYMRLLAVCLTPFALVENIRLLRVNATKYTIGRALFTAIYLIACYVIGFGHVPILLGIVLAQVLGLLIIAATSKDQPRRVDRSLFLRASAGGLRVAEEEPQPLATPLTSTQMRAFARFLGGQWLVTDYALRSGAIFLFLPNAGAMGVGLFKSGSYVTIEPDGRCTATISVRDLKSIRALITDSIDAEELQHRVCRALRHSLDRFLVGDRVEALVAVNAQSDDGVYAQPYEASKYYRAFRLVLMVGLVGAVVVIALLFLIRSFVPQALL